MILKIRARHFKGAHFFDPCNCAITKALMEHFPAKFISEDIDRIHVGKETYTHESYPHSNFKEDMINATAHNFDDTVIRVVNIKGLQEPVELSTLTSRQLLQESKVTA
jgi:hypothetical protein